MCSGLERKSGFVGTGRNVRLYNSRLPFELLKKEYPPRNRAPTALCALIAPFKVALLPLMQ